MTAGAICMGHWSVVHHIFQLQVTNLKSLISTHMATLNHQVKGEELHV
jgi:hypothetical protein